MNKSLDQRSSRESLLRGKASITDLDLMLFLCIEPKSAREVEEFLDFSPGVYLKRLNDRGYLKKERIGLTMLYSLSEEGLRLLNSLKERVELVS